MKVLNLRCAHGHDFEGWFASNDEFDAQLARALVECPLCGDTAIVKQLSAPRLNLGASSDVAKTPASPASQWLKAVRDVLASTEDVGPRFADEARRMHYGETAGRGIRGQATQAQAAELLDEGIQIMALPAIPAVKDTLQ